MHCSTWPSNTPPGCGTTVVMETGGMKGRRTELPKEEFHRILCDAFGTDVIHSEYGMAELTSQAYSSGERDIPNPALDARHDTRLQRPVRDAAGRRRGGINITDLANLHSCAFIETQDAGIAYPDGSFSVLGRMDRTQTRGCNLLVD